MGARVIACASSDDKLVFARAHGAHEVVNYDSEDLRAALKRVGGDHGIDVVFDRWAAPTASRPCARSPGRGGISLSALPPATSRSSRSTWSC
jgi:NADPH:quinone reductase-like Zn-dependent oxidoreductase